jgi:two-component system response regulator HydG
MNPLRLLIVEDRFEVLRALGTDLSSRGVEVESASAPTAAVMRIRTRPYDALVCSAALVESGSLDIIAVARQLAPAMPVYVVAAEAAMGEVTALARGASHYFSRPPAYDELVARLKG